MSSRNDWKSLECVRDTLRNVKGYRKRLKMLPMFKSTQALQMLKIEETCRNI